jgi:tetratricopeptide (TPR) repeat protein
VRRLALPILASALLWLPAGGQIRPGAEANQIDGSQTLFTVLAAINSAGFDAELNSPTNHRLRAAVREYVKQKNPPSLVPLKKFFQGHRMENASAELSQYISWSLSVDGPPGFQPRFSPEQMPPDTIALQGLSALIAQFHKEAGMDEAWKQAQSALDNEIRRYQAQVIQTIFDANAYLRNPTSGLRGRRFQIFIDLLGAPNQVHARSFGDDYFVVITPSVEPRIADIRHAYLHYLLDPLAIRYSAALDKKKGLGDFAQASPILDEAYKNDFVLLAGMCLVKAVEARIDVRDAATQVKRAMSEGFILTSYFYEALGVYEKQEQSLRLYLPAMVDAIDLKKEDQRIAKVEFASQRAARKTRVVEYQVTAPEPSEAAKAAADAEKLYSERKLPEASGAFRKVIESPAPRPVHAKAYFGLARIAVIEKKPDQAEQMFQRTLEMEPEPYERAWAHVYLARLTRAMQDPDPQEIRKNYEAALAVAGAPEGALKAARQELSALPAAAKPSNPEKP